MDPELFKAAKAKGLSLGALLDSALREELGLVVNVASGESKVSVKAVVESKSHTVESKPNPVKSGFNLEELRRNKPKYDIVAELEKTRSDSLDWQPDNAARAKLVKERVCKDCGELVSCVVPCARFQVEYEGSVE